MLRPFKSFLNNLQKNAETFFGSKNNSPDMNSTEEEEEIAADSMYSIDELDPLADPLALDDDLGDRTLDSGSGYASRGSNLSDLDSSDDGQIILVDVNSLKNSFTIPVSYAGNILECTSSAQSTTASNAIRRSANDSDLRCEANTNADMGIGDVTFDQIGLTLGDEIVDEVEGSRSDGSDSGLGLELCAGLLSDKSVSPNVKPTRSNLKRRSDPNDQIDAIEAKKPKRNIQFTDVTVFYFPRIQGFTCVPSQGGCTLGMGAKHFDEKLFTLNEHIAEQKRIHRQQLLERSPRPPSALSTNSLHSILPNPALLPTTNQLTVHTSTLSPGPSVSSLVASAAASAAAVAAAAAVQVTAAADDRSHSSTEESDSEEDILSDNSGSELDTETLGFLQPVSQRQRRALLKAAGVREILSSEKNECRDIRTSREFCGCSCRDYCDPETCLCSQSGIKCQVDRASFPCGCTQDGCGNVIGRLEFNPKRVRTHFIHTIMRLELEKKKSDKKNSLHTYDDRLRLRDSDEEVVDSPGAMNTRLISYNPANNILYPSTAPGMAINSMVGDGSDDASRSCGTGSMAESPLDLHYAFRNDYSVDPTHTNYSLIFPSSSYYTTNQSAAPAPYVDFNAMGIPNQTSSLLPSYSNYSTNIPYNGLMSTVQTVSTQIPTANSASSYLASPVSTDCVHNGTIFDGHATEDFLNNINQPSNTTNSGGAGAGSNSKATNKANHFDGKFNEYVNDTNKLLDVTSVSADELNCLLSDENLSSGHQIQSQAVPSQNHTINNSTEPHAYLRFESDYANKLNADHSYGLPSETRATTTTSAAYSKKIQCLQPKMECCRQTQERNTHNQPT